MTTALALREQMLSGPLGSLDQYIQQVSAVPVLSVEEEQALATRLREDDDLEAARTLVLANLRFVVHIARGYMGYGLPLGDLVQEIPESERFERAVAEACQQLERCGVRPRHVAGNHDVGDKPDPTMPTAWVSSGSLATYHRLFGRSWYSWDEQEVHCIVLNAQLLNSALPEADDQRQWVESDLLAHTGQRIFVFLSLPPREESVIIKDFSKHREHN